MDSNSMSRKSCSSGNSSLMFAQNPVFSSVDSPAQSNQSNENVIYESNSQESIVNVPDIGLPYSPNQTESSTVDNPCDVDEPTDSPVTNSTGNSDDPFALETSCNVVTLEIPSMPDGPVYLSDAHPLPDGPCQTRSSYQIYASNADLEQPIRKVVRPAFCLFTARKKQRRKHYPPYRGSGILAYQSNRRLSSGRELNSLIPNSVATLTPIRYALHPVLGNANQLLGHLSQLKASEAKSCGNLKDNDIKQQFYSYVSTESTLSPLNPNIDLPDVYLNPPSLSSLQSARGSLVIANIHGYPNQSTDASRLPNSCSFISVRDEQTSSVTQSYRNPRLGLSSNLVCDSSIRSTYGSSENLVDVSAVNYNSERSSSHGRSEFQQGGVNVESRMQSPCRCLPFSQARDDPPQNRLSVKEKFTYSKGFGTLKRAISLTIRPKGPKSLGAELQSIMDKHYEMTGIRMLTSGHAHTSQSTWKTRHDSTDVSAHAKAPLPKLGNRRRSWSFGKDDNNAPLRPARSMMKSAISAIHLDCLQPDRDQNSSKDSQDGKSVLSSLTGITLPCIAPLRPWLYSEGANSSGWKTSSLGKSYLDTHAGDVPDSARQLRRATSSLQVNKQQPVKRTSTDFGHCLMGVPKMGMRTAKSSSNLQNLFH
ncbi:hypothetical protein PHET_06993 [Paragonimus heterotremus]|uniref:Uncharacterized protein n=1 Tax=Paragonimus heterotremus TaxID=100268 RepID=A0A8J4THN3_9TREM|nr:hypothetical protein PHET_06993 [Paragonimus heterotremus]